MNLAPKLIAPRALCREIWPNVGEPRKLSGRSKFVWLNRLNASAAAAAARAAERHVLHQREVHVLIARAVEGVAAGVAERAERRDTRTRGVEPLLRRRIVERGIARRRWAGRCSRTRGSPGRCCCCRSPAAAPP